MKNNFRWHKEQINGKWYSVCDHEHVPMIEHTKDDKYKVRNCNGKAILHESFADAEKLAIETYKKFEKFNKSFEGQDFRTKFSVIPHPSIGKFKYDFNAFLKGRSYS